ncbi:MAG: cytochrome c oxidase subunit 3 family protein [Acidobacteria bacterium]|nr:cytochrome c oxidase subunit 3 family protein [Acidobacteriota bacterium]
MWLFLLTEIMFFGGMFTGYTVYRLKYPQAFVAGSHLLDIRLGGFNTAVLIASSLTMALAVHAAQMGKRKAIIGFLLLTFVLGGVFLGVKAVEYSHKFHDHLVPGPNFEALQYRETQLFFSFYFAMTGMHALHMVIGMVMMGILIRMAQKGRFTADYYSPVEMGGLYWHFVDIVWIFLFPLLYLIGRHGT